MNFGIMEEIYFCGKDLNGASGLMRLAKFDLSLRSSVPKALRGSPRRAIFLKGQPISMKKRGSDQRSDIRDDLLMQLPPD